MYFNTQEAFTEDGDKYTIDSYNSDKLIKDAFDGYT